MKITSLLENTTVRSDMKTEHGLSLYIETGRQKILFDMGQTTIFAENAEVLGIDLAEVDFAVLSHGHYDHGGGLRRFLEINDHAPVYIHRDAFLPHYNGTEKYIGLDTALEHQPRIVFTENEYRIGENMTLFSCSDRTGKHSFGSFGLTEKVDGRFLPDDFRHEQYLLIRENDRRILFSGCSHKGILDITEWFEPDVLIGGFHFSKMECSEVLADAARHLASRPTRYYTCHCTGNEQFRYMKQYMNDLHYLSCGETVELHLTED